MEASENLGFERSESRVKPPSFLSGKVSLWSRSDCVLCICRDGSGDLAAVVFKSVEIPISRTRTALECTMCDKRLKESG